METMKVTVSRRGDGKWVAWCEIPTRQFNDEATVKAFFKEWRELIKGTLFECGRALSKRDTP